uniref:Uncharacterized protein n=1 Tax=Meloidogyne incognita TaxID=6306 RepID=A0A914MS15_MELIC
MIKNRHFSQIRSMNNNSFCLSKINNFKQNHIKFSKKPWINLCNRNSFTNSNILNSLSFWRNNSNRFGYCFCSNWMITTLRHFSTASGTAARGGSIIEISPRKQRPSMGKFGLSLSQPLDIFLYQEQNHKNQELFLPYLPIPYKQSQMFPLIYHRVDGFVHQLEFYHNEPKLVQALLS